MKKVILINILYLYIIPFSIRANEFNFESLAVSIGNSEISYSGNDAFIEEVNIEINNCSSFPYYGQEGSSNNALIRSIERGVNRLHQCVGSRKLPLYVEKKFIQLEDIIKKKEINKYITCNFENSHSYIAISTESEESTALNRYPYIRQYPGMIINTNRVSGNFRLDMSDLDRENTFNFYGGKIPREDILPGGINPQANYISNPDSLVIHEMLHWTNTTHFGDAYPDIVYLTQACCFDQLGIDENTKNKACAALFDDELYQEDQGLRMKLIKEREIKALIRKLNTDLHSVSNQSRQN